MSDKLRAQVVGRLHDVERGERGADDGRGQGVGEEVGPGALAQKVDHGLRAGDVAAERAAKRLAERAGQDVDRDPGVRRGAAALRAR